MLATFLGKVGEKGGMRKCVLGGGGDPLLSAVNATQGPQKVYSGASGFQKASEMEPQSDALGYLWKVDVCYYLRDFLHF